MYKGYANAINESKLFISIDLNSKYKLKTIDFMHWFLSHNNIQVVESIRFI